MKASLPAYLMIILGASDRLSSSWSVAENTHKFYTKNKAVRLQRRESASRLWDNWLNTGCLIKIASDLTGALYAINGHNSATFKIHPHQNHLLIFSAGYKYNLQLT